jgi:hypothetical protein
LDVTTIDGPTAIDAFDELVRSEVTVRQMLATAVPAAAKEAAEAGPLVRRALESRSGR